MVLYRGLFALLLAVFVTATQADTTITFSDDRQKEPSSFLIKDGRILMHGQGPQADQMTSIYDSSKNHFIILDHVRKNYYIMDEATINKQIKMMNEMRTQMEQRMKAQLEQMPAEQRQMMEQRMQAMINPPEIPAMKIVKTGETSNINGIKCSRLDVYRGDQRTREVCVADPKAINISEADYSTMRSMFAYMKKMAETFSRQSPMAGNENAMMADMEGIPVEMRDLKMGFSSRLEGVGNDSLDAQLFNIPEGYQKIDPTAMMKQGMAPQK